MAEWGINNYNARKEVIEIRQTAKYLEKLLREEVVLWTVKNLYWGLAMCQAFS